MMMKCDLMAWLASIPDHDLIGIDDGGLMLVHYEDQDNYLELGGIPEEDEDDCNTCAYCDDEILPGEESESTPQGTMHSECAHQHAQEHPEEW